MSDFDGPEIYRSVLESLETGVYIADRDRKILFFGTRAQKKSPAIFARTLSEPSVAINRQQEKGRPRRPPRRCVESRLRGLRYRDDRSLYRSLARQLQ